MEQARIDSIVPKHSHNSVTSPTGALLATQDSQPSASHTLGFTSICPNTTETFPPVSCLPFYQEFSDSWRHELSCYLKSEQQVLHLEILASTPKLSKAETERKEEEGEIAHRLKRKNANVWQRDAIQVLKEKIFHPAPFYCSIYRYLNFFPNNSHTPFFEH